jgi:uncharacterized membrane protein YkoI
VGRAVAASPSKTEEVGMRTLSICLGLTVFLAAWAPARADEEKVDLDKVPKAVTDAVKARFPDAEVKGASKETENGKTIYELEIKNKKDEIDVELTPDGDITSIEKEIDAKDLPKAVAKAVEDKYPKSELDEVEEVTKVEKKAEKLAFYEMLVKTADKKLVEVQVDPDGKILNEEKKEKKD